MNNFITRNKEEFEDLILLKILLLGGGSNSGKTCILLRYSEKIFRDIHLGTVGVDNKTKIIEFDKYKIKLLIGDTSGQERFRDVIRKYYKVTDGIIFVCDLTNYDSFINMKSFVKDVNNNIDHNYEGIICANKSDLEEERKITEEEIKKYGLSQNMEVFEVSAKTGKNINEAFDRLVEIIIRKKAKDQEILKYINNENLSFKFRLDLISSNNYNSQYEMLKYFAMMLDIF